LSLIAAAVPAQPPEGAEAPESARERRGLEGEVVGYLAVPALLVLVLIVGLLVGGGEEEPDSP
jgi:hypothetical protein